MKETGKDQHAKALESLGTAGASEVKWNLSPAELIEEALKNEEGSLTDTGALMCDTGEFTGRSPQDRFIVKDMLTQNAVWWSDINIPFEPEKFDQLHAKMLDFLKGKKLYIRDAFAGDHPDYRLNLRIVNTMAWHNMFCYNMFLRPSEEELEANTPDYTILCVPEFKADPATDGTRQENFAIISFRKKIILIGGTCYTGEMKKGVFSVLNFLLPCRENVLAMHCSANIGKEKDDTAIFFGLSGTGKTTLSTDPNRCLIGDDEHGWTSDSVFNFEGGCYAKVVDLSREKEPEIWNAIRFGAILENTRFQEGTRTVDYKNRTVTENTRTSYPIHFIPDAVQPARGGVPKNIFFLTADAFGVLPPIAKLNTSQAMYHFISGYTAKVAGTEVGIDEPKETFSACFGAAFLPLHPTHYAELLGRKLEESKVNVWLVNTGWTGGPYGTGSRMKLPYTRAMITAALNGDLSKASFFEHPVFGVAIPKSCPDVPKEILNPRDTWANKAAYDEKAAKLAASFVKNFEQYAEYANEEILAGAPKINS